MATKRSSSARNLNANLIRLSSGEHAALYIRQLIFDGELTPGTRVPQDEIAKALGLSRIPLREALIALEREGWVTLEMHRGAFVNALDEEAVRDHYELFGVLYAFAAEKALVRADPTLVDRLTEIQREFDAELDLAKAGAIVLQFHAAVVDAAQSNRLKVLFRAMSTLVPGDFFEHVPDAIHIERASLPSIVRGIRERDAGMTAVEYKHMMGRIGDEVISVLREKGLFYGRPAPGTATS